MKINYKSVDEYIKTFPDEVQLILEKVRKTIIEKAPEAVESISYGMPAYKTNGKPLVYFAGYQKHIGFYATPTGHSEFANDLSKFKQGKGSVQFPIDEPVPYDLIERIVVFRVTENKKKSKKPQLQ
ncbi:iron chaperone [Flavobacterium aestuarii]|uniref:iron chaperone n=1 Tax=Flavobacterium aestuarii TaxID=3149227 RepID=UPI0032B529DC